MNQVSDIHTSYSFMSDDEILARAAKIMETRVKIARQAICSHTDIISIMRPKIGYLPHEVFSVIFLNSQNELIEIKDMFRGTIDQSSVYPREVIIEALKHNAASLIFAHNHPSGNVCPSEADKTLTKRLIESANLLNIRVLDHIIVSGNDSFSFANNGLI